MSVTLSAIRPASDAEWDRMWSECEYATFFQSRAWAGVWRNYTGGTIRPSPRLVTFSDGKVALLPLAYRRRLFGLARAYIFSQAETYGGWISRDGLDHEHAEAMVRYLTGLGSLVWKLNPFDALCEAVGVDATEPDETLAIDLGSGFDAIHRDWSKGHRAAAKQAERSGVTVTTATTREHWRSYYELFEDSIRRWGDSAFSRYRFDLFDEMFRLASPAVRLWLAMYDGRAVAGAVCLYSKRHVVYWHGAAREEFFALRPVHRLMYAILEDACADGDLRWFDFNPSGALDGVRSFKRSFGALPMPCPNVRVEARWLRLAGLPGRLAAGAGRRFRKA